MPWNDKYIILNLQFQIGYIKRKQTNKNIHASLYSGSRGGSRIILKRDRTPLGYFISEYQNTSCCRNPQVISEGGGCVPLAPSP